MRGLLKDQLKQLLKSNKSFETSEVLSWGYLIQSQIRMPHAMGSKSSWVAGLNLVTYHFLNHTATVRPTLPQMLINWSQIRNNALKHKLIQSQESNISYTHVNSPIASMNIFCYKQHCCSTGLWKKIYFKKKNKWAIFLYFFILPILLEYIIHVRWNTQAPSKTLTVKNLPPPNSKIMYISFTEYGNIIDK